MGGLHGDSVLSPLRSAGVVFLKMRPKNGRFTRGPPFFIRSDVCSFLGRLTRGFRSFSVALFVFLNLPLGRFIRGLPFFLYSATCSFLGGGVRFFSAFNAVLFCTFVVWRVVRACLGLPSVGFVNAV